MPSGASVYARLRNAFAEGKVPGALKMDQALTYYAAESSLRRLAAAGMMGDVVLKGARLWNAWGAGHYARPTQDFDYSAQRTGLRGSHGEAARDYANLVREALTIDVDDGLTVDPADFKLKAIDSSLGGCAVEGIGRLHTAQVPMVIEIGFGHALPEGATQDIMWNPILKNVGKPIILSSYRPEMWLAEKVRIAIAYGAGGTRLKDYYDMRALFAMPLDGDLLTRCFAATCDDFRTVLPDSIDACGGFSQEFVDKNAVHWRERRWPDWHGKPFLPGVDPELSEVVADIAAHVADYGLVNEKALFHAM